MILLKFVEMGHDPYRVQEWGMGTIGMFLGIWNGRARADKTKSRSHSNQPRRKTF